MTTTAFNIPPIGLGTFQTSNSSSIYHAVKSGYRLIDCAAAYSNQVVVGEALRRLFADGVVTRDELFIVSKIPNTHHIWTPGVDEGRVEKR